MHRASKQPLACSVPDSWIACPWIAIVMQGRPIYIQHLGQVNIKKIYEVTTEERMLKFHVQEYERCIQYIMPACSKIAGRHIEQTFAILDVKGMVTITMNSCKLQTKVCCNMPYNLCCSYMSNKMQTPFQPS